MMNNDFSLGGDQGESLGRRGNCLSPPKKSQKKKKPSSGRVTCHHILRSLFFFSRYASLYFCCAVENQDNELLTLEIVHRYVELLDKYFGNVSGVLVS